MGDGIGKAMMVLNILAIIGAIAVLGGAIYFLIKLTGLFF